MQIQQLPIQYYFQFGASLLGLIGGFLAYILSLKVRHDILENNDKIERDIGSVKDHANNIVNSLRTEFTRELGQALNHQDVKMDATESDLVNIQTGFTDKVLNIVNGKYRRTEVCEAIMKAVNDRLDLMKELIISNMDKIERGLDRQIEDLRDRIVR